MTMTNQEIIGVVSAAQEGKLIERKHRTDKKWHLAMDHTGWDFMHYDYRVKDTITYLWAVSIEDGSVHISSRMTVEEAYINIKSGLWKWSQQLFQTRKDCAE